MYLSKKRQMPSDLAMTVIDAMDSAALRAEFQEEYGQAFFMVPVLDLVDLHPMTTMETLIEEGSEMIRSIQRQKKLVKNKYKREDLTDAEHEELLELEMQVIDLYGAIQHHLVAMNAYGINVKELEKKYGQKVIMKGYKSGNRHKKSAFAQAHI
jgi:hypothetical protein